MALVPADPSCSDLDIGTLQIVPEVFRAAAQPVGRITIGPTVCELERLVLNIESKDGVRPIPLSSATAGRLIIQDSPNTGTILGLGIAIRAKRRPVCLAIYVTSIATHVAIVDVVPIMR
jgi:hypothetical protein